MRSIRFFLHIFFVILVGGFVLFSNSGLKQNKVIQSPTIKNQTFVSSKAARVLKIIDGDTIEVSLSGKTERIRLIGIDSPEILDERKPVQCFGKEASDKAKEILTGKTIALESDLTQGERDEYGRLLRYVFLEDGTNFNKLMLSAGFAHEYTFKDNFYRYRSEFIKAGEEAREGNRGLWRKCARN